MIRNGVEASREFGMFIRADLGSYPDNVDCQPALSFLVVKPEPLFGPLWILRRKQVSVDEVLDLDDQLGSLQIARWKVLAKVERLGQRGLSPAFDSWKNQKLPTRRLIEQLIMSV